MEIKNRDIFLNLNAGEEIVYVAEKNKKFEFYFLTIPCLLMIIFFFFFLILLCITGFYKTNISGLIDTLFLTVVFIAMLLFLRKSIIDYFFTNVILTNQRLIIIRSNKINSIEYNQIKYVQMQGRSLGTRINLTNKKIYVFYFLNYYKMKNKFKEIYPNYDDSEIVVKEQKRGNIILAILLLLLPFFMYAEYKLKLSSPRNRSYKSTKYQHYAKEPYFDAYMVNLQDKIKSNWNPPKGKESSNVVLLFKVDRNGNVLKSRILKSSNNTAVDNSALEALKKSEPLEPLPKEFKGKDIDVQFTFDYNVLSNKSKL